jgi:hypothetical protein
MEKRSKVVALLALGFIIACKPPEGVACGYHDDVNLARGVLNWIYPDALHVVGAISTAVAEKRLPAGTSVRSGPGLLGYYDTVRAIERHRQQLSMAAREMPAPTFSLLLVEPMLWTRVISDEGAVHTQVHVPGPQAGDLVVISGEAVIRAIANNALTVGEAYRSGLIRLYGKDEQVVSFLTMYDQVGRR